MTLQLFCLVKYKNREAHRGVECNFKKIAASSSVLSSITHISYSYVVDKRDWENELFQLSSSTLISLNNNYIKG